MLRIPGGGGTPLYKLYRYVLANQVGFLHSFGLKTGIHFVQKLDLKNFVFAL